MVITMHGWKCHSDSQIAAKLAIANALIAQGKRQQDVVAALGVSVMTFHRWRKAHPHWTNMPLRPSDQITESGPIAPNELRAGHLADLQLENSRLRRLLTDLLLEKLKLEERARESIPNLGRRHAAF